MIFKYLTRDTTLNRSCKKSYRNYCSATITPPMIKEETVIIVLNFNKYNKTYLKSDLNIKLLDFLNNLNYPTKLMLNITFIIFTENIIVKKTNVKFTERDLSMIDHQCNRYNEFIGSFSFSSNIKDFLIPCNNYFEILKQNNEDKTNLYPIKFRKMFAQIKAHLISVNEHKSALALQHVDKNLNTEQDIITEMISKKQFEELFRHTLKEYHRMKNATNPLNKRKIFTLGVFHMKKISYCNITQNDLNFMKQNKKIIYLNIQETELQKILADNKTDDY